MRPTRTIPGSDERIAEYQRRAECGEPLFVEGDLKLNEVSESVIVPLREPTFSRITDRELPRIVTKKRHSLKYEHRV